jgi:threonine aldolase
MAQASNAIAARIAGGVAGIAEVKLLAPVEANELFLEMPSPMLDRLERDGFLFYRRSPTLGRFVCRFDMTEAEADALVTALKSGTAAQAQAAE